MNILDATEAFAVPGEHSLIDCINPETGKSWINGHTLEQVQERYPGAEVVNIDEWCAAKGTKQDTLVEWNEVTEEQYYEMLNVLPPEIMKGGGFLVGEPSDHHAVSGAGRFAAYVRKGDKFFASSRPMTRSEFIAHITAK